MCVCVTYKLGCNVSIDVGVHTPRNNLSIIFVNEAPFPKFNTQRNHNRCQNDFVLSDRVEYL